MSKFITLSDGNLAEVDDADYEFLNQFEWRSKVSDGSEHIHAVRDVTVGDKKLTVRMHRLITEADHDQMVVHINENGLDNRRRNLQLRTLKPWTGRARGSGFRGVHQMSTNRWRAEIHFAGRVHVIGDTFEDAKTAAREYDRVAIRLYGSNAVTNFNHTNEA